MPLQAICYRAFVALLHSGSLHAQPDLWLQWRTALGLLTMFPDALPGQYEDKHDCPSSPQRNAMSSSSPKGQGAPVSDGMGGHVFGNLMHPQHPASSAGGYGQGQQQPTCLFPIHITLACPRLGVKLVQTGPPINTMLGASTPSGRIGKVMGGTLANVGQAYGQGPQQVTQASTALPAVGLGSQPSPVLAFLVHGFSLSMPPSQILCCKVSTCLGVQSQPLSLPNHVQGVRAPK